MLLRPRLLSSGGLPPWEVARSMFERGELDGAHDVIVNAIDHELKTMQRTEERNAFHLPYLLLELGKSFLQQNEGANALSALEHSTQMFEAAFFEGLNEPLAHERYVEALVHRARLLFLSGQGDCEHHWKKAISHAVRHNLSPSSNNNENNTTTPHVLHATLGLCEFCLEQLRLPEAQRYADAAEELAVASGDVRKVIETSVLQGLCRAQRSDAAGAMPHYERAMEQLKKHEAEQKGEQDAWMTTAFFNLYRNMEHALRAMGEEAKADEIKEMRTSKVGKMEDVVLEDKAAQKKD